MSRELKRILPFHKGAFFKIKQTRNLWIVVCLATLSLFAEGGALMADQMRTSSNALFLILKAIGDNHRTFSSNDDVTKFAQDLQSKTTYESLKRDLLEFYEGTPEDGRPLFVVLDDKYSKRSADFIVEIVHAGLARTSTGYLPKDRVRLMWRRTEGDVLELFGARILSDKLY